MLDGRRFAIVVLTSLLVASGAMGARAGDTDHDGDGMGDGWESSNGLDPNDPSDATEDPDTDHLVNRDEYYYDGDPHNPDSDGDGLNDGSEVSKWSSGVARPNRVVGRVGVKGRCRSGDDCSTRYLLGVRVTLRDTDGKTLASRRTLASGRFAFGDLDPGRYEVRAHGVAGTNDPAGRRVRVQRRQAEPVKVRLLMKDVTGPGLAGQAKVWPTCAAQTKADECIAPLENAPIRVKARDGRVVARVITDADGYYAFALSPGRYTLVAKRIGGADLPDPPRRRRFTVSKEDRGPNVLTSVYDSGMR